MRQIKFRFWDKKYKEMTSFEEIESRKRFCISEGLDSNQFIVLPFHENALLMQYTGHSTKNGRELYEGDIVFVEESAFEIDEQDQRYYLVIVWIPEWSMFASLHISEYITYKTEGISGIDETMFWTYTLEHAEKDFYYAGNIFQNENLLEL